ncbi:M48 family metallopeptidase [Desulforhopalus singaporensis]|uniref:Putative Zn-dependent protease, contains TPR repeats n=1 Tax=Desulforhopalus singaporensis TaxID=91360 RepID=A0A1H0S839_9BACT|nr:M48 family metallopeptidase [Desulforhopalus singaporensis]SDP37920.1 Putative Zn-dependent protease, contains TPR repeats [Desulforhopalus singaporensis]
MYTNLFLFLVAILMFSLDSVPESPLMPPFASMAVALGLAVIYGAVATSLFRRGTLTSSAYFKKEKVLSLLALVFFLLTLYLADPKFYLAKISLLSKIQALMDYAGIVIFAFYLCLMWRAARRSYAVIFGRRHTSFSFIVHNLKINLPIVLPWIVLLLMFDMVSLMPSARLQRLVESPWGESFFFIVFVFFIVLLFPPLLRRLWGCERLPDTYLRSHLSEFCAKLGFTADFYLWPLFEGRMMTAAVVGFVPGIRYILVTPALIETMSMSELEAIMAHEIGHVKKRHLLLYILLIGGFSALVGVVAEPALLLLLSTDVTRFLMIDVGVDIESAVTAGGAVVLLSCVVIYFRFIFGYFIRNFERQADLYSLLQVGSSGPLVNAFEKIAIMSGNIRNRKNWHHFGIGERIDCLQEAERQPEKIVRHDRKVRLSLVCYVVVLLLAIAGARQFPTDVMVDRYQEKFIEIILQQRIVREPDIGLWHRLAGDLMLAKKQEKEAIAAYEKAFTLDPSDYELMNNYAWLLLTANDLMLRNPEKALVLAKGAATLKPKGYVLDTLATAYWANGLREEAITMEQQALAKDESRRGFYLEQLNRFRTRTYVDEIEQEKAINDTDN